MPVMTCGFETDPFDVIAVLQNILVLKAQWIPYEIIVLKRIKYETSESERKGKGSGAENHPQCKGKPWSLTRMALSEC